MSENRADPLKKLRPPLPPSREEHHRTSLGLEKTSRERDHTEYRQQQIGDQGREATELNNSVDDVEELIRKFEEYVAESELDLETLRKSEHTKIKRYKGCTYFGQLMNNKRQGLGVMLYQSGRVYEGQWEGGAKHGRGYERFSNGSKYVGSYVNGKPEGLGVFKWPNNEVYEGMWVNGQKHGSGMWTGARGDSYIGEWKFGMTDGYGVHTWINGDKYEGQFKSCLKHGEGFEKFANGDKYIGNYVNGKPDGYGQYTWSNGSFYKGNFKNGLRHGHGVWKKGPGESDQYEGEYINDKKCGYGIFNWAGGNIYKGNYFEDARHGYGEMYWADGSYYKGNWEKGVQHGEGQLIETNSLAKKGTFHYNMMVIEEQKADAVQVNKSPIVQTKSFRTRMSISSSRNLEEMKKVEQPSLQLLPTQQLKPLKSTSRTKILSGRSRQNSTQNSLEKIILSRRASQQQSLSRNKSPCARCTQRHQKQSCRNDTSRGRRDTSKGKGEKTTSFYVRSTRLPLPPKSVAEKDISVHNQLNTSTASRLSAINKKRVNLYATTQLMGSKENDNSMNTPES